MYSDWNKLSQNIVIYYCIIVVIISIDMHKAEKKWNPVDTNLKTWTLPTS